MLYILLFRYVIYKKIKYSIYIYIYIIIIIIIIKFTIQYIICIIKPSKVYIMINNSFLDYYFFK